MKLFHWIIKKADVPSSINDDDDWHSNRSAMNSNDSQTDRERERKKAQAQQTLNSHQVEKKF